MRAVLGAAGTDEDAPDTVAPAKHHGLVSNQPELALYKPLAGLQDAHSEHVPPCYIKVIAQIRLEASLS